MKIMEKNRMIQLSEQSPHNSDYTVSW